MAKANGKKRQMPPTATHTKVAIWMIKRTALESSPGKVETSIKETIRMMSEVDMVR